MYLCLLNSNHCTLFSNYTDEKILFSRRRRRRRRRRSSSSSSNSICSCLVTSKNIRTIRVGNKLYETVKKGLNISKRQ